MDGLHTLHVILCRTRFLIDVLRNFVILTLIRRTEHRLKKNKNGMLYVAFPRINNLSNLEVLLSSENLRLSHNIVRKEMLNAMEVNSNIMPMGHDYEDPNNMENFNNAA